MATLRVDEFFRNRLLFEAITLPQRHIPDSNVGLNTEYPHRHNHSLPQSIQANAGTVLSRGPFLQDPLKSIIHQLPKHSTKQESIHTCLSTQVSGRETRVHNARFHAGNRLTAAFVATVRKLSLTRYHDTYGVYW
jgi:hypothetical protein